MLRIFRRLWGPASDPSSEHSARAQSKAPAALPVVAEPIPVPEVVEGNGESDWNLWQDSVMTLESLQQVAPASNANGYEETQPLTTDELNAYIKAQGGNTPS